MIRTRALIEHLSYPDLVTAGLIPDLFDVLSRKDPAMTVKTYSPFVYATSTFSFYGVLLDYVVRAGLRLHLGPPVDLGIDPVTEIIPDLSDPQIEAALADLETYEESNNLNNIIHAAYRLISLQSEGGPYPPDTLQKHIPTLVNIIKALRSDWASYGPALEGPVRYNQELTYGPIQGHPDIMTARAVLDIKTTGSFKKMACQSWLQVLTYYALAKPTQPRLEMVGFVLPMQRLVLLYGLEAWNYKPFLDFLITQAHSGAALAQMIRSIQTPTIWRSFPIGTHISKGKNINTTLEQFVIQRPGHPCQMCLLKNRGKRSAKAVAATEIQCMAARNLIQTSRLKFFIHAPYNINLCMNEAGEEGDDFWQQRYLNWDLAMGVLMGAQGVVVHTGALCNRISEAEGLLTMESMVRTALTVATKSCPLLLETSAGEGTDVCTQIEALGEFFERFTRKEKKRLGVCVDTCHVFSCGYDPLAYLEHWAAYCSVPIRLIHFNDSAGLIGCCHDRHALAGEGHIGDLKMRQIAAWATQRSIPMVKE
jgi:deoxyribonuclease-4